MAILVENLSREVTEDDLKQVFKEYGRVNSVNIPTDRETGRGGGLAFVSMDTDAQEGAAITALDGAEWMGKALKVSKAKPREERRSFGAGGSPQRGRY